MGTILSQREAEDILFLLSKNDRIEIERDKIRFGEYFIQSIDDRYRRLNPINVIVKDGVPELMGESENTVI